MSKIPSMKRFLVVKIFPQEGPQGHMAQEFVYRQRNLLSKGIFWLHCCLDPGLKNSFLGISIQSIEQGGMKPHHVIQFFHIWSCQFYENLGGKARCLAGHILSLPDFKVKTKPKVLLRLQETSDQTLQDPRKSVFFETLAPQVFGSYQLPGKKNLARAAQKMLARKFDPHSAACGSFKLPDKHTPISRGIGSRTAHNPFERQGQTHTPASPGWSSNSELLNLYKFVVPKGKEPYFELLPFNTATSATPAKVYLDSPRYFPLHRFALR
jgi:hypothetical protein